MIPDERDSRIRRCLAQLRTELAASYPTVDRGALLRITKRHGLESFPAAFLVPGGLSDRSPDGARAVLARLTDPRRTGDAPLFSSEFYRLSNPDVAAGGVAPWAHYQVFGRLEGRSPHPLIDHAVLSAGLPGSSRAEVFDRYFGDPACWLVDPGPYVDVQSFVLNGTWDGHSHPLAQLVRQLGGPWVHRRLMLIDAGAADAAERLVGAVYLLTREGGRARLGRLATWVSGAPRPSGRATYTTVPGFFVGSAEAEVLRLSDVAVSPDATLVRHRTTTVGLVTGDTMQAPRLIVLAGPLRRAQLHELVVGDPGAVLAPFDRAQEIALRQLRRDTGTASVTVLAHGVQVQVSTEELVLREHVPSPEWEAWTGDTDAPGGVAVVLTAASRRRSTGDPDLRATLAAGASLCLIDGEGLNTWLPVIQARGRVVVEPQLVDAVAAFVDADRIRLLPGRSR